MRQLFVSILIFASFATYARVEIAFIPLRDANGTVVQFENGGRFAHVAVSFNGFWFHAHPKNGVELTRDLSDFGDEVVFLTHDNFNEPAEAFVWGELGKPFSYLKLWHDKNYTYCSKLIAQAYGIPPSPMTFSSKNWRNINGLPKGALGSSADKLFRIFLSLGFQLKNNSCDDAFNFK